MSKMGRPPLGDDKRGTQISISLTQAEADQLRLIAKNRGYSVSQLVRQILLAKMEEERYG